MTVKTPSIQTQKLIINHKKKPKKLKREKKKMMIQSKTSILKSPNKRLSPKLPKVRPNSLLRKTPLQMKTMMTELKNLNPKKRRKPIRKHTRIKLLIHQRLVSKPNKSIRR